MFQKLAYSMMLVVFVWIAVPAGTHAQVENLVHNPGFEEDEVILNDQAYEHWWTWGWEDGLNSTVEFDETDFVDGKRSLKVFPTGATNWYFIVANSPMSVVVGNDYTASFWIKAEEPRPLGARFKATDNSVDWGYTDFEVTTEWAEYTMTSEALNAELKFEIFCAGADVPFWLDYVFVYEGQYVPGIKPVPPLKASNPNPVDGALLEQNWATLSWTLGVFATWYDVYLGDNLNDVDNGTGETFRGNQVATFFTVGFPGFPYPDGLVPGTTYYWRIDEVNEADPNSPWKGDIWSFSVAPKKAYDPDPADEAESVDLNAKLRWTAGLDGVINTVYFGEDFDEVNNATQGVTTSTTTYGPGPLEREKVYYWRVDVFDAVETHKGDVWTFTTPGAVGNPQPTNGAIDVPMTTILSWTAADNAASHEVYLGLDKEAVRNAGAGSPEHKGSMALGSESFDPSKLLWHTTYYWRVDEVYTANTVKGPIWSFTTANSIIIDNFESYTDDDAAGQAIWQTWVDGFGVPDNGAQAGYLVPPYCEQTIVHGGSQSMPLLYVNEAGVTNSEALLARTVTRDWTEESVGELSLWFRGNSDNATEPLYVAVSNAAGAPGVVAHQDANAAQSRIWNQWVIPLQAFTDQGINLTNVDKLAIGLGSKGGAATGGMGTMFIDDIRLYRP